MAYRLSHDSHALPVAAREVYFDSPSKGRGEDTVEKTFLSFAGPAELICEDALKPNKVPKEINLEGLQVTIGSKENGLGSVVLYVESDPTIISPKHAVIVRYGVGQWVIKDQGAPGGVLVNRVRVSYKPLSPGDEIIFGGAKKVGFDKKAEGGEGSMFKYVFKSEVAADESAEAKRSQAAHRRSSLTAELDIDSQIAVDAVKF
mmetsp:Transcript_12379/g.29243  ORF Transcript_12379/g.29243 Transcript_12379/m.29243 type:complete len:203 (+) Transcript_12379:243-851(+)